MFTWSARYLVHITLVISIILFAGAIQAGVPHKINYQGRLTDTTTGEPQVGSRDLVFRLYDDPGAGTLLWSESQTVSTDSTGVFSAILGSVTPIEISLDGPVWLEVEVGGEVLSPRREVVSVPFAFMSDGAARSLNADSLGGYAVNDFVRMGQTSVITSEMLMDGTGSGFDADMVDGLNADAFADTGHAHDDRYYTQDALSTPGTVNDGSNPVDWTKLKNVPSGFADGSDDIGAADSHSLDAVDGSPVDAVFVDNAGNVGIGTSSPGEKLEVAGAAKITAAGSPLKLHTDAGYIELESDNPDPMGLRLSNATRDWYLINGTGLNDRLSIYDGDAGAERLTIDGQTGRVGIGVSNPYGSLTIHEDVMPLPPTEVTLVVGDSDGNPSVMVGRDTDNRCKLGWFHPDAMILSTGGIHFTLHHDDSDNIVFSAAGEIGVGTKDPEELLHIVGENPRILIEAETSNPEINLKSEGDASNEVWALYKDDGNDDLYFYQNGAICMALKNSTGSVGIGTHNVGSYRLYVQGEAYSTVAWSTSDRRFKEEIGGIDSALDRLLGLRGVRFRWKTEEYADRGFPEGEHFGVIAQEAEEVLPEIVKDSADGEKAVAYAEIIPVLIESIRELKAENDALKERIAALEVSRN